MRRRHNTNNKKNEAKQNKTKQPPISIVNSSEIERNCNANDLNDDNDESGMHLVTCNHNMHVFPMRCCILLFTKYLSICFYFPKRISDDVFAFFSLVFVATAAAAVVVGVVSISSITITIAHFPFYSFFASFSLHIVHRTLFGVLNKKIDRDRDRESARKSTGMREGGNWLKAV